MGAISSFAGGVLTLAALVVFAAGTAFSCLTSLLSLAAFAAGAVFVAAVFVLTVLADFFLAVAGFTATAAAASFLAAGLDSSADIGCGVSEISGSVAALSSGLGSAAALSSGLDSTSGSLLSAGDFLTILITEVILLPEIPFISIVGPSS